MLTATMVWSIGMADNGKKKSQSPPNRTSEATNKYGISLIAFVLVHHYGRVSPDRGASSASHDDDDMVTDQLAGELRREQELEEPTAGNDQSTEQEQQQQQEEEEEERKCSTSNISVLKYNLCDP